MWLKTYDMFEVCIETCYSVRLYDDEGGGEGLIRWIGMKISHRLDEIKIWEKQTTLNNIKLVFIAYNSPTKP